MTQYTNLESAILCHIVSLQAHSLQMRSYSSTCNMLMTSHAAYQTMHCYTMRAGHPKTMTIVS